MELKKEGWREREGNKQRWDKEREKEWKIERESKKKGKDFSPIKVLHLFIKK